jgi:DNA polymerase elongation subunit (family B)
MNLSELSDEQLKAYKQKLENEIDKYDNWQNAKKITLNSAYGAMGNQYFRFYDVRLASAVTLSGQLVIQWIAKYVNDYLNKVLKTNNVDYIIAIDTDSIYVSLEILIDKIAPNKDTESTIDLLDSICEEKIQKVINTACEEVYSYTNGFRQKMRMKRECLAKKGVWTRKKRYALNVYDTEGVRYKVPKLKIMGLEAIRSNTPFVCRGKLKDALKIIMTKTNDDLIDFIDEFRSEFMNLPIEEIAQPTSVKGLEKYFDSNQLYIKGTPFHVKGALTYNHLLKENGIDDKYDAIESGDKIKTLCLKERNPTQDQVIAFHYEFPPELDYEKYVDKAAQFDKVFMKPLRSILEVIGWNERKINTLW